MADVTRWRLIVRRPGQPTAHYDFDSRDEADAVGACHCIWHPATHVEVLPIVGPTAEERAASDIRAGQTIGLAAAIAVFFVVLVAVLGTGSW